MYDNLLGAEAPDRLVKQVVETGRLVVCGPYKVDEPEWPQDAIKGASWPLDLRNNKWVR